MYIESLGIFALLSSCFLLSIDHLLSNENLEAIYYGLLHCNERHVLRDFSLPCCYCWGWAARHQRPGASLRLRSGIPGTGRPADRPRSRSLATGAWPCVSESRK